MTRQQAIHKLETSLTETINEWIVNLSDLENPSRDTEAFETMGWIGDDLPRLMAKSAMATWEASLDVQAKMSREGADHVVNAE